MGINSPDGTVADEETVNFAPFDLLRILVPLPSEANSAVSKRKLAQANTFSNKIDL